MADPWTIAAVVGAPLLARMLGGGDQTIDTTQRQEIPKWLEELYLKRIQMANNIYGGNPSSFLSLFGGNQPQNINMGQALPKSMIKLAQPNPLQKALGGG